MRFYNSMTRSEETFIPLVPGKVALYTCGPTVYNYAHIGNFRAYMFEDMLCRSLEYRGFEVTQVMNLTDVDDKTIKGAMDAGVSLDDFTRTYKDAFFSDLKVLGIRPAEYYPAATEHIPEMIHLIERLFENGLAYTSEDKSVYFSSGKFATYGKLARIDRAGLRPGVRVSSDEYEKEHVGDFALWKAWDEEDGDVWWDSPWGRGRPGWHIECSAMSMKYLGESFDIHTGGIDNLFPHHDNEIAQSEGATGKPFVHTWLHCAHLRVNGEKMSKSTGNFYTLRDLVGQGFSGREIRYVLMGGHYRQPLNFTFDAVAAAHAVLSRVDAFVTRVQDCAAGAEPAGEVPAWLEKAHEAFGSALDDDLNLAEALAVVHSIVNQGNRKAEAGTLDANTAAHILRVFAILDTVLNVLRPPAADVPAEIEVLAEKRKLARVEKQWAESDALRDEMAQLGWAVKDTPEGQKLSLL